MQPSFLRAKEVMQQVQKEVQKQSSSIESAATATMKYCGKHCFVLPVISIYVIYIR